MTILVTTLACSYTIRLMFCSQINTVSMYMHACTLSSMKSHNGTAQ